MAEKKMPTRGEVQAMSAIIARYPEVIDREVNRKMGFFLTREGEDDARSMLTEYLLRSAGNYVRRFLPERSEEATGAEILARLDDVVREPRGAFRMAVRNIAKWVRRDLDRARRRTLEVYSVQVLDDREEGPGLRWEQMADESIDPDEDINLDDSRAVVAEMMAMVYEEAPDAIEDVALFLAHEEQGGTFNAYKAHGTNRGAVVKRLARLRPLAIRAVTERGAWLT